MSAERPLTIGNNALSQVEQKKPQQTLPELLDMSHPQGFRMYQRSAILIMLKALEDIAPTAQLTVVHSISNGIFTRISGIQTIGREFLMRLRSRMKELIAEDLPFTSREVPMADAIAYFKLRGEDDKARLLGFKTEKTIKLYELGGVRSYFSGTLTPSTGYVKRFFLRSMEDGIVLRLVIPGRSVRARGYRKLLTVLNESVRWRKILEVEDIGMLNEVISSGRYPEFVHMAEALHEKKIAQLADQIVQRKGTRVVLLSGPSASGKTTFAKRLAFQMRINGFKTVLVSMDDYFLDREKTPKTPTGDYDYESPHALNIELFKQNLADIIAGRPVRLPRYDFKTGRSTPFGGLVHPDPSNLLIIEGIHGLNPYFSDDLPREAIYKIYVSAITEVPLDRHNRIPTSDTRFLRRILRDHQFRNYSAEQTILRWPLVREGESKYIFRFQEEADVFFNTALIYELCALKSGVEPLLVAAQDSPAYEDAMRLQRLLSFLLTIPKESVPPQSILREFLGGGYFCG